MASIATAKLIGDLPVTHREFVFSLHARNSVRLRNRMNPITSLRDELVAGAALQPPSTAHHRPSLERILFILVVGLTLTTITRKVDGSVNVWSRLSVTLAVVERGQLNIDPYLAMMPSEDWSFSDGRFYSNKAPGPALLAVPVYVLQRKLQSTFGVADRSETAYQLAAYFSNLFVGVLPTLIALNLFWVALEQRYQLPRRWAFALTAIWGCGSLALPYSVMFFGHQTAAASFGIAIALTLLEANNVTPKRARIALAALCMGVAVSADYLTSLGAVSWTIWVFWQWRKHPAIWLAWTLGAAVPTVLLLGYHAVCFGSPWIFPYAPEVINPIFLPIIGWEMPSATQLYALTIAPQRGWFYATPVYALMIVGIVIGRRQLRQHPELLAAASAVAAGLLLMTCWQSYHGGSSVGPRYLVWTLPMATLLIVPMALRRPHLVISLGLLSAALMLAVTVTEPLPSLLLPDPFISSALPMMAHQYRGDMLSLFGETPGITFISYALMWSAAGFGIVRRLQLTGR